MKKLTKIGVSALAGSLVASTAYAGDLSVSGTWEVTGEYVSGSGGLASGSNTGNPFGSKGNLAFSGSGETDFGTASFFLFTSDAQGAVTSHAVSLDMGDMGTVAFDQGTGGYGLGSIDDKMPSAYEEVWNGTGASNADILDGGAGSAGVFGYKNDIMGSTVTIEYDPSVGGGDAGDGATSFTDATYDGSNLNGAIINSSLVDGLTVGVGYGETSWDRESTTTTPTETESVAAYATYAFGPVTVGYQQNYTSGSVTTNNVASGFANDVEIMAVAFNVNENLSISYEDYENTYKKSASAATGASAGQADVTQDIDGFQLAYTMGGASFRLSDVSVDNSGGTSGSSEDRTEVSLLMAF